MQKIFIVLSMLGLLVLGAFVTVTKVGAQTEPPTPPFTYYPPGSIQPKTGAQEELSTGYADYQVHAPGIGFPLRVPAFPNSQVYRPGGGFNQLPNSDGQCDNRNYSYPWRDNYCEKRSWTVEDCPGGHGHQGQDIRPPKCEIDTHEVLAVEDGKVYSEPETGELIVQTHDKKRRYDYLHLETVRHQINSKGGLLLDSKGNPIEISGTAKTFTFGSDIHRGQTIGYVSSIQDGVKDKTTRHLHFNLRKQRFDSKGRVLSGGKYFYHSPYMSLIRAYETALGQTGTMLPAPAICKPNTARCTTTSVISCNQDGTSETLTSCTTAQCKKDTACKTGTPVSKPPDMSVSHPPPDLAPACQDGSCTCGCDGARCKPQLCTPGVIAYCSGNNAVTCPGNGCAGLSSVPCPGGYVCSGGNCYPGAAPDMSTGSRDMAAPKPPDMTGMMPKPEVCNGIDDDGNGIIDDPASCWQWITRFKDPITGACCYGIGTTAPFACAAYDREFVLFAVPTVAWSDGSNAPWVQCSRGVDHILTKKGGTEQASLEALGWNCFLELGYFFNPGSGPRLPKRTPYANTCPLYRQKFMPAGSQSHLFTPFNESVAGAVCEPPTRADVVSITGCGVPPGC